MRLELSILQRRHIAVVKRRHLLLSRLLLRSQFEACNDHVSERKQLSERANAFGSQLRRLISDKDARSLEIRANERLERRATNLIDARAAQSSYTKAEYFLNANSDDEQSFKNALYDFNTPDRVNRHL